MCTSIAFYANQFYFGRNLDLDRPFGERVTITPRGFVVRMKGESPFRMRRAVIGMANVTDGFPLYAEGANEDGLCIAGLNFPHNAVYGAPVAGRFSVTPFELPLWLLGQCSTVAQAKELLKNTVLLNQPFRHDLPLTPLHWHIADQTQSIVLESTKEGVCIYENRWNVLTNNPPFPIQDARMQELKRFSNRSQENALGLGTNAVGLPGDFSSPSRFMKAAWLNQNSACAWDEELAHFFSMLAAVAPLKGSVLTPEERVHFCRYSCCIDVQKNTYSYKRYGDLNVRSICMTEAEMTKDSLTICE